MADSTTEFKPYIPADKITPEFTLTSILTGVILVIVVFGGDTVLFSSDISVAELYSAGGASAVWSKFIRYIGATPKKQYRCLRLK